MTKPELSLSEILEKYKNYLMDDTLPDDIVLTPAEALHSLQVKIDAERKEAVEEYQEKARKFVEDVEKSEGL